jgi:hypothetical protein
MSSEGPWIHLVHLLEDDSPVVRHAVMTKLRELGRDPLVALDEAGIELNPAQRRLLASIRGELEAKRLDDGWERWSNAPPDLEGFHVLICTLLSEYGGFSDPRLMLEQWTQRYRVRHPAPDLESLVAFLFSQDGLQGDTEDYFAPRNSSLSWALEHKRGLPITLCSALILVGKRVGVDIHGVAFPGHFLAQSQLDGQPLWIDAFDGGRFIAKEELVEALGRVPATTRDRVLAPASVIEICARILRNVVTSLERAEDVQRHRRAVKWLGRLDDRLRELEVPDYPV